MYDANNFGNSTYSNGSQNPSQFSVVGTPSASSLHLAITFGSDTYTLNLTGSFNLSGYTSAMTNLVMLLALPGFSASTFTAATVYKNGTVLEETESYSAGISIQTWMQMNGFIGGATVANFGQVFTGLQTYYSSHNNNASGSDAIYGYAGAVTYYDYHTPGTNSDVVVGGTGGINTVVLPLAANAYAVQASKFVWDNNTQQSSLNGYLIYQSSVPKNPLVQISAVQRIQYGDNSKLALDTATTQAAGQTALLLGAALPGTLALDSSKQALVGAVIGLFDAGFTLQQLSGALLRLPVWDLLTNHTNATAADIATYLVHNVYGGTETAAITNAAIAAMTTETPTTQGTYLASLAQSSTGQSHIGLVGLQTSGLAYV